MWGRGSNDPGNVAKTHYLPHNPIGHLVTVLREDLQANGPLLHPVMLVRVKGLLVLDIPSVLDSCHVNFIVVPKLFILRKKLGYTRPGLPPANGSGFHSLCFPPLPFEAV